MIEIKEKMSKILGNMKLPLKIRSNIEEIYLDYEKSYKNLIEYLKNKYPDKEQEIIKLDIATSQDYKEDMNMTQTIEFEEYELRRAIIIEAINDILPYINRKQYIPSEEFENNMLKTIKKEENERFTKIVMDNTITEIISSSKYFINKINHLGLKMDGELEIVEKQFLEEIKTIKEKAEQKSPEINQIISEHFKSIYEQLENIVEKYKTEIGAEKAKNTIKEKPSGDNER